MTRDFAECTECRERMPATRRRDARFCSPRCRVRAHRRREKVASIPECMRSLDRWVRADGKRPIRPSGQWASSTKPWTWSSFEDAQHGAGDGFGFMLGDGIGCLDLDYAIDNAGALKPWAAELVAEWSPRTVFAETSMSGKGVHLFVRVTESRGQKVELEDGRAEFYSWGRFIRMTGKSL